MKNRQTAYFFVETINFKKEHNQEAVFPSSKLWIPDWKILATHGQEQVSFWCVLGSRKVVVMTYLGSIQ